MSTQPDSWLHEKEFHRDRMTWGLASESQLTARAYLVAEKFGQNHGRPLYQAGIRFSAPSMPAFK